MKHAEGTRLEFSRSEQSKHIASFYKYFTHSSRKALPRDVQAAAETVATRQKDWRKAKPIRGLPSASGLYCELIACWACYATMLLAGMRVKIGAGSLDYGILVFDYALCV